MFFQEQNPLLQYKLYSSHHKGEKFSEGIFNIFSSSSKGNKSVTLNFSIHEEKFRVTDLVPFEEYRKVLKIPSEILPPVSTRKQFSPLLIHHAFTENYALFQFFQTFQNKCNYLENEPISFSYFDKSINFVKFLAKLPPFYDGNFLNSHQPTLEILFQVYVLLLCDESNIEKRGKTIGRIFIATIQLRTLLTFMVKSVSTAGVNYKSQRGIWVSGRGCLFEPLGVGN